MHRRAHVDVDVVAYVGVYNEVGSYVYYYVDGGVDVGFAGDYGVCVVVHAAVDVGIIVEVTDDVVIAGVSMGVEAYCCSLYWCFPLYRMRR